VRGTEIEDDRTTEAAPTLEEERTARELLRSLGSLDTMK